MLSVAPSIMRYARVTHIGFVLFHIGLFFTRMICTGCGAALSRVCRSTNLHCLHKGLRHAGWADVVYLAQRMGRRCALPMRIPFSFRVRHKTVGK